MTPTGATPERAVGPQDMRRWMRIAVQTPAGPWPKGTVVDWGPSGAKVHVVGADGDRIQRVPYSAMRRQGPHLVAMSAASTPIQKSVRAGGVRLGSVVTIRTIRAGKPEDISGPVVQVGADEVTFVDQLGHYRTVKFSALHEVAG